MYINLKIIIEHVVTFSYTETVVLEQSVNNPFGNKAGKIRIFWIV